MADGDRIYLNGVDGTTGDYLVPPMKPGAVAAMARGNRLEKDLSRWLGRMWRVLSQPNLGLPLGVKGENVAQAGWAVVFHEDEDPAIKDALAPLVEHRRKQIGGPWCHVLDYQTNEGRSQWLGRHGVSAGNVIREKVPLYLLLVGSPARIPFRFGHLLSVEYVVGRLQFDTPAEYARYVADVIAYETARSVPNARQAVFFAPRHDFDGATQLSADSLVKPLMEGTQADGVCPATSGIAQEHGFELGPLWGPSATKAALRDVLRPPAGSKPPAFLFTASHGLGWPKGDNRQLPSQGALVCQDWPGLGGIGSSHYFAADDLPDDASVRGLISFHFACYSAGTPSHDRFFHQKGQPPPPIANDPFFAALPRALLSHPRGGALACIGHVERAWGYSIATPQAGPQLIPFRNAIGRILSGLPVGYAMKDFYERFAALATNLSSMLEEIDLGEEVADAELAASWIERNDAEAYLVIGDPAIRLRVEDLS